MPGTAYFVEYCQRYVHLSPYPHIGDRSRAQYVESSCDLITTVVTTLSFVYFSEFGNKKCSLAQMTSTDGA